MSDTPLSAPSVTETAPVELSLHPEPPPLRVWEGGAVRVGNSRVGLAVVIDEFEDGATPEDIVRSHTTLSLADVYGVIAYYLRYQKEVRAFLKKQGEEADIIQREIEAKYPRIPRSVLLARREAEEKGRAAPGR